MLGDATVNEARNALEEAAMADDIEAFDEGHLLRP
jgi:hypothetical protein